MRDCLEGFLAQKTNFDFEVLIHDDASSDGTQDVIRDYSSRYPEIIKPILQTVNQYNSVSGMNETFNFPRARGTYIALCEGDDYWVDPFKLQRQVDFLESNPDYGAIHTDYLELHERTKTYIHPKRNRSDLSGDIYLNLLNANSNSLATASIMIRAFLVNEFMLRAPEINFKRIGDYPLALHVASKSKIAYLDRVTCIYRVLQESASHSCDIDKILDFRRETMNIVLYFSKNLPNFMQIRSLAKYFFCSQVLSLCARNPKAANRLIDELESAINDPFLKIKLFLFKAIRVTPFIWMLSCFLKMLDRCRNERYRRLCRIPEAVVFEKYMKSQSALDSLNANVIK